MNDQIRQSIDALVDTWNMLMNDVVDACMSGESFENTDTWNIIQSDISTVMSMNNVPKFEITLNGTYETCDGSCLEAAFTVIWLDNAGNIQTYPVQVESEY